MKKIFCIALFVALWVVAICSLCEAAARVENGVNIIESVSGQFVIKEAQNFTNFEITGTSSVYNMAGSSTVSAGELTARGFDISKLVQISVGTLTATNVIIEVEGRNSLQNTWGDIMTKTFTTITTKDDFINVLENPDFFRVAGKKTGTGTAFITVTTLFLGRTK